MDHSAYGLVDHVPGFSRRDGGLKFESMASSLDRVPQTIPGSLIQHDVGQSKCASDSPHSSPPVLSSLITYIVCLCSPFHWSPDKYQRLVREQNGKSSARSSGLGTGSREVKLPV